MANQGIIFGIDPGFGRTGYGIIVSGKTPTVIDYGCIETPKSDAHPARLASIYRALSSLITHHQPTIVGIEELFFKRNVTTGIKAAQARGVALLAAEQCNVPIYELKPAEIKLAITGNGAADKRSIQNMVQLILKLQEPPSPDDAADALAIALATANYA